MFKFTKAGGILRLADKANIPKDPDNKDYQEVLDWVAAGNVIAPIDPPTPAEVTEAARKASLQADMDADATIAQLKTLTGAQIDTFFTNNVTNAAQAINVLRRLTKLVVLKL